MTKRDTTHIVRADDELITRFIGHVHAAQKAEEEVDRISRLSTNRRNVARRAALFEAAVCCRIQRDEWVKRLVQLGGLPALVWGKP